MAAGEWIKWTKGLASRREVALLASMLGRDRHEIAGRLMVLWEWCDENFTDADVDSESLDVSLILGDKPFAFVDALLGLPGMAEAMTSPGVRWLEARSGGRLVFPSLARHNGTSAKTRAYESRKKQRQRQRDAECPQKCPADSGTKPGPEREKNKKEYKDKNPPNPPETGGDPAGDVSVEPAFLAAWNSTPGVVPCRGAVLTDKRRRAFRARAADPAWDWRAALKKFPLPCFDEPNGWRPDVEWFLRPDSVTKILEGKYDWTKRGQPRKPFDRSGPGQLHQDDGKPPEEGF